MVRPPYFDRNGVKRGAWDEEEDNILRTYVQQHGHPNWRLLPSRAGLRRCGKSCRLRWVNYLKPGVRRGNFSKEEKDHIIKLHALHGKKWSDIAKELPGRTDNDIKNYWHAHIQKRGKRRRPATSMGEEEQSSELGSCITTDSYPQDQTSFNNISIDVNAEITNAVSNIWAESNYDQTCFNQVLTDLPPFPGDGFFGFGLSENDMSTFFDSSDVGITNSWNSTSKAPLENFLSETFEDMVLWS